MSAPCPPPWLLTLRLRACFGLAAMALAGGATALVGQNPPSSSKPVDPRIANVISELEKTRNIHQAALSPDGQMIAWVVDGGRGHRNSACAHGGSRRSPPAHRRNRGPLPGGKSGLVTGQQRTWPSPPTATTAPTALSDQADVYLAAPGAPSASPGGSPICTGESPAWPFPPTACILPASI